MLLLSVDDCLGFEILALVRLVNLSWLLLLAKFIENLVDFFHDHFFPDSALVARTHGCGQQIIILSRVADRFAHFLHHHVSDSVKYLRFGQ